MSVLKNFKSLGNHVTLDTPFGVAYRVAVAPYTGLIDVSCTPPYNVTVVGGASPTQIAVTADMGTATIVVSGPPGQATIAIHGDLVERHSFAQDIQ